MRFYMICDKTSGLWYKKGSCGGTWVDQEFASVWTTPHGAAGAMGNIDRHNRRSKRKRDPQTMTLDTEGGLPDVALVKANDWEGLYFDGHLIEQGNNIRVEDILGRLGIAAQVIWADDEWLNRLSTLPARLDEVQHDV